MNIKLNPKFITGFADAESNFYIRISKKSNMKTGWTVEPVFSIRLHNKDFKLLNLIQSYFGVGKVNLLPDEEATFRISSLKELNVIISHFDKYPLKTQKYYDFILFKQVIDLMKDKEHLTLDGIIKIASIKASMNTKKEVLDIPNVISVPIPSRKDSIVLDSEWVSGFTDPHISLRSIYGGPEAGDGCFSVSIIKSKALLGETSWIRFILTQHNRDLVLMNSISTAFFEGAGKINSTSKGTNFTIQKLSDIIEKVLPLFDNYPLIGNKAKDFEDFKRVAILMSKKAHLTKQGLEEEVKKWNEYTKKIILHLHNIISQ